MPDYSLIAIRPKELNTMELTTELEDLPPDEQTEAYRIRLAGGVEAEAAHEDGEMLFIPAQGRAGIAWAGEAIWTDASSPDEAMERYLDHTIVEDEAPKP